MKGIINRNLFLIQVLNRIFGNNLFQWNFCASLNLIFKTFVQHFR